MRSQESKHIPRASFERATAATAYLLHPGGYLNSQTSDTQYFDEEVRQEESHGIAFGNIESPRSRYTSPSLSAGQPAFPDDDESDADLPGGYSQGDLVAEEAWEGCYQRIQDKVAIASSEAVGAGGNHCDDAISPATSRTLSQESRIPLACVNPAEESSTPLCDREVLRRLIDGPRYSDGKSWREFPNLSRVLPLWGIHHPAMDVGHIRQRDLEAAISFWRECSEASADAVSAVVPLNTVQNEQLSLLLRVIQLSSHLILATYAQDIDAQLEVMHNIRELFIGFQALTGVDLEARRELSSSNRDCI